MTRTPSTSIGNAENLLSRSLFYRPVTISPHQVQLDAIQNSFVAQATHLPSLLAMGMGSFAYRVGSLGVLSLGGRAPGMARFFAPLSGLSLEVSTYRMASDVLEGQAFPARASWWADFANFGALKLAAWGSQGQNRLGSYALQDSAMLASQQFAHALNLAEQPQGSFMEQLFHAEMTRLQMHLGGSLMGAALGQRLAPLEASVLSDVLARGGEKAALPFHLSRELPSFNALKEGDASFAALQREGLDRRKIPFQASFPAGYFLDGMKPPTSPEPTRLSHVYHELMERVGNRTALKRYIQANLDPESRVLRQLTNNLKPMRLAYEVHAVVSALRYLKLQDRASQNLRRGFFDLIAVEEDPRALAQLKTWGARDPLTLEIVSWLHEEGITHPDPWTRHYAIRLLHEWALAHPEIALPEHGVLRGEMARFAHTALGDVAWTNMMLGWHFLHGLEPERAMDERYLADIPMAHLLHPQNLEFGLARYVDASMAEGAFLKYQRTLSRVPLIIGTQAVMGTFSLEDIHPSHSLADFNPNALRRFEAVRQKYGILLEMHNRGSLTRENVLREFLFHQDPEEGPIIFHWQGRNAWLKGGHHRMTALYLAAGNVLIPREWLRDLPLLSFDWSHYLPERIYYQYFSRGSEPLQWRDLLPPGYPLAAFQQSAP